jgi:hypothetical protein
MGQVLELPDLNIPEQELKMILAESLFQQGVPRIYSSCLKSLTKYQPSIIVAGIMETMRTNARPAAGNYEIKGQTAKEQNQGSGFSV